MLLTETSKLVGLDGTKMSKSYGNAIAMREEPAEVDAARSGACRPIRRACAAAIPGDPEKCPVWQLHQVYSNDETKAWVVHGCTTAAIGCLDCKQPVIEAIVREQAPWRERAEPYLDQPEARALDRRGRHRARAHGGARDDARSARGDGAQLLRRRGRRPRAELSGAPRARPLARAGASAAFLPSRLSVPANRRLMLALCRQTSSAPITRDRQRDRVGAVGEQVPERREHRGDDRGERRVAEEGDDDQPGGERRRAEQRVDAEQRAGRGGDALAAAESGRTPARGGRGRRRARRSATVHSPRPCAGPKRTTSATGSVALQRIERRASGPPPPCCPSAARWSRRDCPSRRCADRPAPSRG